MAFLWVASAFWPTYAFNPLMLRLSLDKVVWIYHTFGNKFEFEKDFTKYLKESCKVHGIAWVA